MAEQVVRFIAFWFIHLDNLLILMLFASLILMMTRFKKWGRRGVFTVSIIFITLHVVPVGLWGLESLENRFPKIDKIPEDVTGAILLGGSFDLVTTAARGEISYSMAGDRLPAFIKLARQNPHLKLAFTGGGPKIPFYGDKAKSEAELTEMEMNNLGFDSSRVIFESKSKNTIENAAKLKEILDIKPGEKWLLVTSAFHMPRSVGLFRGAGFDVIAYPVDYHTPGNYEPYFFMGLEKNLIGLHHTVHEYIAMATNYLMGRSDALYPSPIRN